MAALLAPAMALGEKLVIEAEASSRLLGSVSAIQDFYQRCDPQLARVELEVMPRSVDSSEKMAGSVATFFSLGVDSSYTLAKNLSDPSASKIEHLLLVEGFDIYLWESQRFGPLLSAVEQVASAFGLSVLPVTTNLREFSDRVVDWVRVYHGAAMASVALALGDAISRVYIAASQTSPADAPRGAHPALDPLWGTETLTLVHDGLEADRLQKVRFLAKLPILLKNLRVCTTSELTDAYNCGRCEKCLRTMIALHIAGLLDLCATLPHHIDPELVRSIRVKNDVVISHLRAFRNELGTNSADVAIGAALDECLARSSGGNPVA